MAELSESTQDVEFMIKVRKKGGKAWFFLSSNGGMNRLLIHAIRYREWEAAQRQLAELERDNPEYEGKVV